MKKFIGYCLVLLSFAFATQAQAGLVPGTISKGAYSDNAYCAASSTVYAPTTGNYYCNAFATCEAASCNPPGDTYINFLAPSIPECNDIVLDHYGYQKYACSIGGGCALTGGPGPSANPFSPGACILASDWNPSHNMCQDASCGCGSYTANPVGSFTLTDYSNFSKQPSFGSSGFSRKLIVDQSRFCTANAYKTASIVEPDYDTWTCPAGDCTPASFQIRNGGSNAVCGLFSSTDNLITSFDQLGNMSNSAPTDGDNTCTVEGRYASIDDNGPSISITNWGALTTNLDKWCSLTKWQLGKGSNLGCEYLKTLGSHPTSTGTGAVDLLEGLAINIGSDPSGIGSVFIELGKCTATYDFPKDNTILNSTYDANGVKSANTQNFTIPYSTSFNFAGATYPSLRAALGASGAFGLNGCLDEGKNYLRITAKDNARSNNDGVTLVSNATVFVSGNGSTNYPDGGGLPSSTIGTATVNIDQAAPSVALTGDAKNYFDSNASANCFIGSTNKDQRWKNYTISGAIRTGDPYGPNCAPVVDVLSSTTLTCSIGGVAGIGGSGPSAPIYTSPAGVNPTTGKFTAYTYDGFGPVPTTASCDWGCKAGYTKNATTKTCVGSVLPPSNACASPAPACSSAGGCSLVTGSPSTTSQSWVKNASTCGFVCSAGYTGANCEIAPPVVTPPVAMCCQAGTSVTTYCWGRNITMADPLPVVSCSASFQNGPPADYINPFYAGESSTCNEVPCDVQPTSYSWVTGNFGTCNASCGGGTQVRSVLCQDSGWSTVADMNCSTPKPEETHSCNTQSCGGGGGGGAWAGCSVYLGGTKTADIAIGGSYSVPSWQSRDPGSTACEDGQGICQEHVYMGGAIELQWKTMSYSCSASSPTTTDGVCGNSPATCTVGSVIADNGQNSCGQTRGWTCQSPDGGANAFCSYANPTCGGNGPPSINGVCGSSPATCTAGTVVSDNNQNACNQTRSWSCNGLNGGTNASCTYANPTCTDTSCHLSDGHNVPEGATFAENRAIFICDNGVKMFVPANCGWTVYPGWTGFPDHGYSDHRTLWCGDIEVESHYSWVTGSYGACSATCGGWSQTRSVVCKDEQGSTVQDSYCTDGKPDTTISCNSQACGCSSLSPKITWDDTSWEIGQTRCWSYVSIPSGVALDGFEYSFSDPIWGGYLTLECRWSEWTYLGSHCPTNPGG